MSSPYPTSPRVYTTKQNDIDVYEADHINDLQDDVVALQTYVGTNPHGSVNSLAQRMNALSSGSGGFFVTNADFTGTATYPGRTWYRSDIETLKSVRADGAIQSIGNSFSNVLFQYSAIVLSNSPEVNPATLIGTGTGTNRYLASQGASYTTVWQTQWVKISGVNNITAKCQLWSNIALGTNPNVRLSVGTVIGTKDAVTGTNPQFVTLDILDVSALDVGTTYNVVVDIKNLNASGWSLLGNFISFGS